MYRWHCPKCQYQSAAFVNNSRQEEYCLRGLQNHIRDHHTCQYCGAGGMEAWRRKRHEIACKPKHELKVAREAMLLICLAAKAADKDPNPSAIATLAHDVLPCIFKHFLQN